MRTPSTPIPLWAACPPKAEAVSYLYKNLSLTSALNSPENVTPSAFKGVISEVAQSCLSLCDPTDSSLPGSAVHGIFQARILEWAAISFSKTSNKDNTNKDDRNSLVIKSLLGELRSHKPHGMAKIIKKG